MYTFGEIVLLLEWLYLLFSLKYLKKGSPLHIAFYTSLRGLPRRFDNKIMFIVWLELQNTETKTMRVSWKYTPVEP